MQSKQAKAWMLSHFVYEEVSRDRFLARISDGSSVQGAAPHSLSTPLVASLAKDGGLLRSLQTFRRQNIPSGGIPSLSQASLVNTALLSWITWCSEGSLQCFVGRGSSAAAWTFCRLCEGWTVKMDKLKGSWRQRE